MTQKADLIGRKFGHLTVKEQLEERQNGYIVWRCSCGCGGEIRANTRQLLRGTVTSCGCVPKTNARTGRRAEDLTGRRFGNLTVLYRGENKNGRTRWVCRCSCGNLHTVSSHDLKSGHVKSCGCKHYLGGALDITGQKFGRLCAMYATDRRDRKGSVYWHCRCECGNELEVTADGLIYGNYKSCGCMREEIQKNVPNLLHRMDGTCVEWLEKRKSRSDNTSGFRGVFSEKNGKFRAAIGFKRQKFYIGTFDTFEEAVEARKEAEALIHDGFVKAYYDWQKKAEQDPQWAENTPLIYEVEKVNGRFRIHTNM